MRILAISHLFPHIENTHHGIFAARQFVALKHLGSEIVVLFPTVKIPAPFKYFRKKWRNQDSNHKPIDSYKLEVVQVPCLRPTKDLWFCRWDGLILYLAARKKIMRMHKENPFDIIYGRGLFPGADTAIRFSKLLEIPAVGAAIGSDVNLVPNRSRTLYRYTQWVIQNLDGLLANGAGLADKIKEMTGRECQAAHGVVDLDVFRPANNIKLVRESLQIPVESKVLLFAGSLKKEKGIYELLDAFSLVQKKMSGIILYICGVGVEYDRIVKTISQLNISDSVRVIGTVEPANMHKWMQASDIFVLPSYMEGMPNVVMEAMACGVPVIATAVGGLPEAVGNSEGVILIKPKNTEQLINAIEKLAGDRNGYEKMSIAARQTAEKKFGAKANGQKIFEYLGTVVEQYNGE